jgi:hypothetical protein
MPILISASIASILPLGVPDEVVYLPEGVHDITPTVNGKPQRITVRIPAEIGESIAAALQASLSERQKANVRPWFDFEHKQGKASAIPKSFRYAKGKGVMASVEWTGAGKEALEGKDFSYLSPTFVVDSNGIPSGLPERGPLAALVNEPAFRDIPRIAAQDAGIENQPINTMSKLIYAALALNAAAENAETEAVRKIETMSDDVAAKKKRIMELEAELSSLKNDYDKMKTEAADATKARHTALVEAAITTGKIAPKDEDTKTQTLELLEANEALGTKFLEALPAKFEAFEKPIVNASEFNGKGGTVNRVQAAQAKARQELGNEASFKLIWARAAEIDPEAFN